MSDYTIPLKTCPGCGESKPATTEYFHRDKTRPDGLYSCCKACKSKRMRERYAADPERARKRSKKWRDANPEKVREDKRKRYQSAIEQDPDYNRKYYAANAERMRSYSQQYYATHKESKQEYNRKWRAEHPEYGREYYAKNTERLREYSRKWAAAHPEYIRKRVREYALAHPEWKLERDRKWRLANAEKRREYQRNYAAANPEVTKAAHLRRRARKCQAEGTHTGEDIQMQYRAQKGKCYYCGAKVGDDYHVDHVIPLSRGGSNGPENIVIACPACNMAKHDKLPHEWPEGGRLL